MKLDINKLKANIPASLKSDISPQALEKWNPNLTVKAQESENTISILDVIGEDYWGEGVTSRRIAAALRSIGAENDVTVYINSPGGDMFEGLAIHSLLKEHKGKVTVKILSLAASAASVIAMAGDEVQIAKSAFFMIHNAWIICWGNRNDLRDYAEYLEPFDYAMADLYSDKTGSTANEMIELMDKESWIGGSASVEQGFADSIMTYEEEEDENANPSSAIKKIDMAMAKAGVTRSERRKLLNELKSSTPSAAGGGTPGATTTNTPSAVDLEPLPRISFNF